MATILAMKKRFDAINTDAIITEVMTRATGTIADQQAEQQFTGVRKDGTEITPQYSPFTVEMKQRKGQPSDRVTLHDTGQFQRGIYARISGEVIQIDSTDSKTVKLQEKYGKKIFGLNDQHIREVLDLKVKPEMRKQIQTATGLTMK